MWELLQINHKDKDFGYVKIQKINDPTVKLALPITVGKDFNWDQPDCTLTNLQVLQILQDLIWDMVADGDSI